MTEGSRDGRQRAIPRRPPEPSAAASASAIEADEQPRTPSH
jgi:hypothetical protein